jgi:hypothetical protein
MPPLVKGVDMATKQKRGRPRKEKTSKKVIMRPLATGNQFVAEDGVVYEKHETYAFKNRIEGLFWYKGDDGSDKKIDPGTIRDDISARERKDIISCDAYYKGYIVEWNDEVPELGFNYNALNDVQIEHIVKKFKRNKDKEEFKEIINQMTSIFSLAYFIDKAKGALPGSLTQFCEGRLSELKENEEEKNMIKPKVYKKDKMSNSND